MSATERQDPRAGAAPHEARRRWIGWALAFLAVGVAAAWSLEPYLRREVLFEAPLSLVAGSEVTGTFTPNLAAGFTSVQVRFLEAGSYPRSEPTSARGAVADRLLEALGGQFFGARGPAGLRLATAIHLGPRYVLAETTDDSLSGSYGTAFVGVNLGTFRAQVEAEHRIVVRVEYVADALREFSPRLVVVNAGDWWNYRWLDQTLRPLVAGLGLLLCLGLWWGILRRTGQRRPAASDAGGA